MVFKFETPTSSSTLTFGPSTPSGGVFTFGQSSSRTSNNNNESGSSNTMSEIDGVCDLLHNMSTTADSNNKSNICANCGKEGTNVTNTCNKCKGVLYCNAACKKKHRQKHKKDCEKRVTELHDEQLFKQPPPAEDCPICFLRIPVLNTGSVYYVCCGKMICTGCVYAPLYDSQGNEVDNEKCPFCRTPHPDTEEEHVKRLKKRVEANDGQAFFTLGSYYRDGLFGLPQDYDKALELFHRAAELGNADAYGCIGNVYENGEGIVVDKKKAKHYYELGAMGGDVAARYNLGLEEEDAGNIDKAIKHFMIAVRCGDNQSLEMVKEFYANGNATKEDYTKALQSYQIYLDEIKSDQRDQAAAVREDCRYY